MHRETFDMHTKTPTNSWFIADFTLQSNMHRETFDMHTKTINLATCSNGWECRNQVLATAMLACFRRSSSRVRLGFRSEVEKRNRGTFCLGQPSPCTKPDSDGDHHAYICTTGNMGVY
jgi:hypothetical protein